MDIFDAAKPVDGEWFYFKKIGDAIQGTYIGVRNGVDSFNNQQNIYSLQDKDGKIWQVGFRTNNIVMTERMNGLRLGQIVGLRFDEEKAPKTAGYKPTKIVRVYADPKLVDKEWLESQKAIEATYVRPSAAAAGVNQELEDEFNDSDIPFGAPSDAAPAGGNLPRTEEAPRNEALDAVRNLAKTKGLITDAQTEAEGDAAIEAYTGLALNEENLTKIIISLTGYTAK